VRIMALDYGERRIGVALSDPDGIFAQPLLCLDRRKLPGKKLWSRIASLVREHAVERLVLGLPLHMDGRQGEQAAEVKVFGERLAQQTGLPVEYVDERWTTLEAERAMRELGVRRARASGQLDATAAALLLRTFLERRREAPESSL
jgi:putative holliday junction resolvase